MHLFGFGKGPPALHRAVQSGEVSSVRLLLQKCPNINEVNEADGRTALSLAAACGSDVILGELLDRRAAARVQDKEGNTPLHLAAAGGHLRCVQLLLSSRNADTDKAQLLHTRNTSGLTPLFAAAAHGKAAVVEVLLRSGADMHTAVLKGRVSVGHLAARGGHVQVLAVLAAHGFDLKCDTLDMNTLLHEAAQHGHTAAVAWLLQAGVSHRARNAEQKLALDLARAEQHHAVVQLLLAANANASATATSTTAGVAGGHQSADDGPLRDSWQQQQQQGGTLGLQPGQLPVYPEDERYKFYPIVDKKSTY